MLILTNNVSANLRIVPVTQANQKELELNFTLTFEKLTEELILVRATVPKEGKLKDLSWPSVFIPSDKKAALVDVPLASEPLLKDRYYFIVNKKQIAQTWLHLHCITGGSSEIRYEIALDTYQSKPDSILPGTKGEGKAAP